MATFLSPFLGGLLAAATLGPAPAPAASERPHWQQARRLSQYYRFALRLSGGQRRAVQRCTYQQLCRLDSLRQTTAAVGYASGAATPAGPAPAEWTIETQYDAAMLRILAPGQYSAFCWLRTAAR